jgi:large subunit ribosomal protein L25
MSQISIEARGRQAGGKNVNRRIRKAGSIPAVIYGPGKESIPLLVNPGDLTRIMHSDSGQNTIFIVNVDGSPHANAMIKDYQLDPVKGNLIHADLIEIAMDRLLEVTVEVEPVGEAAGVKLDGGIMDFVTRAVDVECLPGDIPESIKVDVSHLKINDYIRVKNLQVSEKIRILTDPEIVIVTISPPIKEEVPVVEAPVATAEPEVIKKGKVAEEGEGAEAKK